MSSMRRQSPARVPQSSTTGSKAPAARAAGSRISTSNSEKLVKRSPAGSDLPKLQGAGYQKPKPSTLASRAIMDTRAHVPTEASELTVQVADGPRCGSSNTASGGDEEFVPDEEEEPFVPEEDVQGSVTQGDNLMFAKARMRRQNSPGGLPGSPSLALGSLPSSPGASIMFVPQQSS